MGLLDGLYSSFQVEFALENLLQLDVPGGLHRFACVWNPGIPEVSYLLQEPFFHHFQNTPIDSVVQVLAFVRNRKKAMLIAHLLELMSRVEVTQLLPQSMENGQSAQDSLRVCRGVSRLSPLSEFRIEGEAHLR